VAPLAAWDFRWKLWFVPEKGALATLMYRHADRRARIPEMGSSITDNAGQKSQKTKGTTIRLSLLDEPTVKRSLA
jgi:hypothetical protein